MEEKFTQEMREILAAPFYRTDRIDELRMEIEHNCFFLRRQREYSVALLLFFLATLKERRRRQAEPGKLLYYLWSEESTGVLHFNFINAAHGLPPFGCTLLPVAGEANIVEAFLNSPYADGIPFNELSDASENECDDAPFQLPIYWERLG